MRRHGEAGIFDTGRFPPYHAPAMVNPPANFGSPTEWANRKQTFEIKGKVGDFQRLVEIVRTDLAEIAEDSWPADWQNAAVTAQMSFGWHDEAMTLPLMTGRLSAELAALCQRCLEPFELSIAADINMLLQHSSERQFEDSCLEVWEIASDTVCLADIVEELLVMALPLSAKHESIGLCGSLVVDAAEEEPGVARPFAKLRAQMDNTN